MYGIGTIIREIMLLQKADAHLEQAYGFYERFKVRNFR